MPKRIKLHTLTSEEEQEIRRLAKSRKEPARIVQRAQVISAMLDDPELAASRAGERVGFRGAPLRVRCAIFERWRDNVMESCNHRSCA